MTPRKAAILSGSTTYFGGKNCKHCDGDERYTSSGNCVPCEKLKVSKRVKSGYYIDRYDGKKDEILAKQKVYYSKNSEGRKIKSKEWAEKNKEKVKFYKKTNKAMRRAKTDVGISGIELMNWAKSQHKICNYCKNNCDNDYHIDHVIPLSKGGNHELCNLVIACKTCNLRKSNKGADEFREMIKLGGVLK